MKSAIEFFDAIAHRYDREFVLDAVTTRTRMSRLTRELASGASVLDLGVGTGRELPALLDAGLQVTGLDASSRMLEICARRARTIPLVCANFFDGLPFPDASFDAVLALHGTLSHPPDIDELTLASENESDDGATNKGANQDAKESPAVLNDALSRVMKEIARVLKPGGLMAAEVPSPGWLSRIGDSTAESTHDGAYEVPAQRMRHDDPRSGASIDAVILSDEQWRVRLSPWFAVTIEALSPAERLLLARAPR